VKTPSFSELKKGKKTAKEWVREKRKRGLESRRGGYKEGVHAEGRKMSTKDLIPLKRMERMGSKGAPGLGRRITVRGPLTPPAKRWGEGGGLILRKERKDPV